MAHLWTGKFRVYFNDKSEYPLLWSVDHGTQKSEHKFHVVSIHPSVHTYYDLEAPHPESPTAWIEGEGKVYDYGTVCVIE